MRKVPGFNKNYIIVFSALFGVQPARAEPAPVTCPASAAFSRRIYNCGKNSLAALYAQQCAKSLLDEARARGQALQAVMELMKRNIGQAQSVSMEDAKKRLALGIASLTAEIENLQNNTDRVADYAGAMIDIPGSKGDATSLGCFNSAFHDLQKTVNALDREIISAKRAREAALAMAGTLTGREGNMDSVSGPAAHGTPTGAAPRSSLPKDQSSQKDSQVTGIVEDMKKQQLPQNR